MANPYRAEYEIDTGEKKIMLRMGHRALMALQERVGQDPVLWFNSLIADGQGANAAPKTLTPRDIDAILRSGIEGAGGDADAALVALDDVPHGELSAHAMAALMRGLIRPHPAGAPEKNGEAPAGPVPA